MNNSKVEEMLKDTTSIVNSGKRTEKIVAKLVTIGYVVVKDGKIVGVAEGEFLPSDSDVEEIEAKWYTKSEVLELMKNEMFASRTQAYCFMWCEK